MNFFHIIFFLLSLGEFDFKKMKSICGFEPQPQGWKFNIYPPLHRGTWISVFNCLSYTLFFQWNLMKIEKQNLGCLATTNNFVFDGLLFALWKQ